MTWLGLGEHCGDELRHHGCNNNQVVNVREQSHKNMS